MKTTNSQDGSAHVVIVVILVLALLGTLGFIFYQNFIIKDSANQDSTVNTQSVKNTPDPTGETPAYTLDNAVAAINTTLQEKGCNGSGASSTVAVSAFKEVDDSAPYAYEAGVSKINTGLSYAFVQYGCGSQGLVALLKKTDDTWVLVSDSAMIYPMCDDVKGKGFPISIIEKCYVNEKATEPVAI